MTACSLVLLHYFYKVFLSPCHPKQKSVLRFIEFIGLLGLLGLLGFIELLGLLGLLGFIELIRTEY